MTEIKGGKANSLPMGSPACRCRCEYDLGGPWFVLEMTTEQAGMEAGGGCWCGCQSSQAYAVQVFAVI
jgi:hypothetical protein